VARDASSIADKVIAHLSGLVGAKGAPDHPVRSVTDSSRTLKFTSREFEKE
jgi:hypothetical protein